MKGTAWKFGDDIDTDIIVHGRYLIYIVMLQRPIVLNLSMNFTNSFIYGIIVRK